MKQEGEILMPQEEKPNTYHQGGPSSGFEHLSDVPPYLADAPIEPDPVTALGQSRAGCAQPAAVRLSLAEHPSQEAPTG